MRFFRRLMNLKPSSRTKRYLAISIPVELCGLFETDMCVVEVLPDKKGISVKAAHLKEE
jgi:hypothetical protein